MLTRQVTLAHPHQQQQQQQQPLAAVVKTGLAVSQHAQLMAVSRTDNSITLYRLPDGQFEKFVSLPGSQRVLGPHGMCFTASGTLLVAEATACRVQELTLTGERIRFYGNGDTTHHMRAVDTDGKVVVVSAYDTCNVLGRIFVYDAYSGFMICSFDKSACMRRDGEAACLSGAAVLTPDGQHIIVPAGSYLAKFTTNGVHVRALDGHFSRSATCACFDGNGDMVICQCEARLREGYLCTALTVSTEGDVRLRRQWELTVESSTSIPSSRRVVPVAFVTVAGRLYVLSRDSPHVLVYE